MTDDTLTSMAPPAEPTKAPANSFPGGKNATCTGHATTTTKDDNAYSFIWTPVCTCIGCDCCKTFIDLPATGASYTPNDSSTSDDSSTSNDFVASNDSSTSELSIASNANDSVASNDSTTSEDSIASNDSFTSKEKVASDDSVPRRQCIDEVTELLSSWSVEKLNYLKKVIENIEVGDTIFWCQGLCDYKHKSLALGGSSNLDGDEWEKCPSAKTFAHLYKPMMNFLDAILVFINIRDLCERKADGKNCKLATCEEAETMAEVICSVAELVASLNGKFILNICGGSQLEKMLLPKIKKKMNTSTETITFVIQGSYHLSYYSYFSHRNFFTKELQEYQIYLSLQKMCEDLSKVTKISMGELLEMASQLTMVVDHSSKSPEEMQELGRDWKERCAAKIQPFQKAKRLKWLKKEVIKLTAACDEAALEKVMVEIELIETEYHSPLNCGKEQKRPAEDKRLQELKDKEVAESKRRIEHLEEAIDKSQQERASKKSKNSVSDPADKVRGVTQRPSKKWRAQLKYAGKSRYIGVFDSKEKASLAYEMARKAAYAGINEHTLNPIVEEQTLRKKRKLRDGEKLLTVDELRVQERHWMEMWKDATAQLRQLRIDLKDEVNADVRAKLIADIEGLKKRKGDWAKLLGLDDASDSVINV